MQPAEKETRAKNNHGVVEPGCFSIHRVQPFQCWGSRVSCFPPVSPGVIHIQTLQVCFSMNTYFAGYGLKNQGLPVFFNFCPFAEDKILKGLNMNSRRCNLRKKKHVRNTTTEWLNLDAFRFAGFNPFSVRVRGCPVFPRFHRGLFTFKPYRFVFQ